MEILTNKEGFIYPVIFLIAGIIILVVTYKKHTKWMWLSIVPILVLFHYNGQIENIKIERKQESYLISSWSEIYKPLSIKAKQNKEQESELYDEWIVTTDGGEYLIRFHIGQSDGYEMYDTIWETETLQSRANVLSLLSTLKIEGTPIYNIHDQSYKVITDNNEYTITMNKKGRVDEVSDKKESIIYKNEEHDMKPEGRPLTRKEVN